MKKLLTIAALAIGLSTLAQTADAPEPIGNAAIFTWNANIPEDYVDSYNVYLLAGASPVKLASTTKTEIGFASLLAKNGTYALAVSAVNREGESALSTNIFVKYFAKKPNPPGGLRTIQPIVSPQFAPAH